MFVYALIALLLICVLAWRFKVQKSKKRGALTILRGLTRMKFNNEFAFTNENECSICWDKFEENQDVSKLSCNEAHYFHSECIENWISNGTKSANHYCQKKS